MVRTRVFTLTLGFALLAAIAIVAQTTPQTPQTPATSQPKNDYSKAETWLCRPGREDACSVDMTTTVVTADGKLSKETFTPDPKAPIDCFYVYPTVSLDTGGNSDMNAGPEENNVIRAQFARFGSACRLYAPLYRQVTLTALRAGIAGRAMNVDRALGYNDVLDAWNYYLKNDNQGRGVVLVGHSQGSGVLTQLIRNEIDGKPVQERIISAMLLGTSLSVPKGRDVGGAFQSIPLCHSADQIGCVIAYASFRSNVPPPSNSRFGRVVNKEMQAACTNPAALGGGSGALHAYLSSGRNIVSSAAEPRPWVSPSQPIETPFVSVPGLLTAECVSNEHGSYLSVTVHGDPNDPRTDDIAGDVMREGQVQADWGLHLIDANLAMGNLVDIASKQGKSYLKKKKK
jgi:hypothetical protein